MPSKFGLNGTEKPAPLIRYGDPRSKLYTTIDWRESSNANKTLITNLRIVTFGRFGIDRSLINKTLFQSLINLFREGSNNFQPLNNSLDPREGGEKVIFAANPNLEKILGKNLVIKKCDLSGDHLKPSQQMGDGKILQRAIEIANLDEVVEVNRIFGFMEDEEQGNYLFLERIEGGNFQQMQKGEVRGIPEEKIKEILLFFKERLLQMKTKIEQNQVFIESQEVTTENKLQRLWRRFDYYSQLASFNEQNRQKMQDRHPDGFRTAVNNLELFYNLNTSNIMDIINLIKLIEENILNINQGEVYNLIGKLIGFILTKENIIKYDYVADIQKRYEYGQDNLMFDFKTGKIVIIDPGPPCNNNKK